MNLPCRNTRCKMNRIIFWRLSPKRKVVTWVMGVILMLCSLLVYFNGSTAFQEISVFEIKMDATRSQAAQTNKPAASPFKQVDDLDLFLYSAVANEREPVPGEINLIITAFDSAGIDSLLCCMVVNKKHVYTVQASVFFKFYTEDILGPVLELFKNAPTKAKQYACAMPQLGLKVEHVTLTTSLCPVEEEKYLPVFYPKVVPQGIAVCAKSAFGNELDPQKLMEWFEVQRLLGVDHIQIMDLNNPEPIQKVFRYYTQMGLLNVLPYQLPGPPYGRGLDDINKVKGQVSHDETLPTLDCRQRVRGYTYVLQHDMDEVIMPSRHLNIGDMLREQFMKTPDAAGFFFLTEFFIYDWGPKINNTDVSFFRYLTSTLPHDECKKYAFLSSRVEQARTHTFTARSPYQKYYLGKEVAILHHYRKCPKPWSTCFPPRIVDESMLRFQGVLEVKLKAAREATGLYPKT